MSGGDWWTSQNHADQKEWPKDRVHGWAPGNYSCTCGDCGIHYAGDKRSVQCYPCAAKFVPPPRPETIEEVRADRDRLQAELQECKAELARVRRNHLRRMESACREMWHNVTERKKTARIASRYIRLRDAIRATLTQLQGKEGK